MRYIFLLVHRISLRQRYVNHKFSCVTRHSPGAFQEPAGMLKKFYQRQPLTFSDEEPLCFRRWYSLWTNVACGAPRAKPMVPKKRPRGANIPHQRTNSPTGGTPACRQAGVVLLVRDRIPTIRFIKLWKYSRRIGRHYHASVMGYLHAIG